MKLTSIVAAHQKGVLDILGSLPIKDDVHRYEVRVALKGLREELKIAYEEQDNIRKELDPENKGLSSDHPSYDEFVRRVEEFWKTDSKLVVKPCIFPDDLKGVAISVYQEDILEELGLKTKPKAEPGPKRPERMHVPAGKSGSRKK